MISSTNLNIAVVRFSALGDVVMVAAAVRKLQLQLPHATITWITSPQAFSLLSGMPGIEFVVMQKPRSLKDYFSFYRKFRHVKFDVVLAMQANLRINLLYPALRATRKIGFDRTRAREGQWLFCGQHIPFRDEHLVDSFLSFTTTLTGEADHATWVLPLSEADIRWAHEQLHTLPKPWIVIHPHSSKAERNWLPERYAEVIHQAQLRWQCSVILTGGNAHEEKVLCEKLTHECNHNSLNFSGNTTPKQLAALLSLADILIAPDTGAVHIARAMNTPVIGLYAVASPTLSGPYEQMEYCIDRYPQAVQQLLHKDPEHLPWNTRVHHPEAMSLITTSDVMQQIAKILKQR